MRAFTALLLATLSWPPIPASAQAARSDTLTAADLLGAWVGSATHRGESAPLAIELKPAEDGKLAVEMSIPAIHWVSRSVGVMPVEIEGDDVTIGPFAFVLDRGAGTLSGILPAALVPVHQVPVTLRRTERIDFPSRPLLDAPVVTPSRAWTYEGGAAFWDGTAFSNGVVYAGGEDGRLHAIEAGTGDRRWIFQAGGAIRTRPTVDGDDLFLHADDGFLHVAALPLSPKLRSLHTGKGRSPRWRPAPLAAPLIAPYPFTRGVGSCVTHPERRGARKGSTVASGEQGIGCSAERSADTDRR